MIKIIKLDVLQYKGTWLNGKINGPGQIIHTNHKFIGMFQDNLVSKLKILQREYNTNRPHT